VAIADEPNLELLRKKAVILESENERLSKRMSELLHENMIFRGMTPQAIAGASSGVTRAGNEGRPRDKPSTKDEPQTGHGPTDQPELELVHETFDVDEPDRQCTVCGDELDVWEGAEDEVEVIESVERKWVVKKCKLRKRRCKRGCCVVTADGPEKLIKGGRYGLGVAVDVAIAKYVDHLPLERQVRMARRQGARLTSQTLWDQILALATLLAPLCVRLKEHILLEPVIGTDLTGFKLIAKGGSKKRQVWQLSCPTAVYFEMLDSKKASAGEDLFMMHKADDRVLRFAGTAVMDGAPELLAIANKLGFSTAGCWSHARRKVLRADKEAPGQVAEFLDLVGGLYAIDRKASCDPPPGHRQLGYRQRFDFEKLRKLRDTESREVCQQMQDWILRQTCVPGGLLKGGLSYIAARWTRLNRFLDDPLIPLDNNRTEGSFVGLALGRRNYVGARSTRGTQVAARFYTIAESARVNGVDGYKYLHYAASSANRGDVPLLPHEWNPGN